MPTLHVSSLSKSYGATPIYTDVSFRLPPRERLALVGRNGAGKTTLLRTLAGEIGADSGTVGLPRNARLALHDQRPPRELGLTLAQYVGEGLVDVHAAEDRLRELESAMAGGDHADETMRAYADAQAALETAGGYAWRSRLESILRGLGFSAENDAERELSTFSGGELTRASLARVLSSNPDILLLDEPTNHLDLASLEWLERELQSLDAAIVLVSHDRWFLESVATGVIELDRTKARVYAMRYSAYRRERALQMEQAAEAFEAQKEEIERLERFVTKFRAGTRARQAQSVAKRIDRIDRLDAPHRERAMAFGFPKTVRPGRLLVEVEELELSAGDKTLLHHGDFALERGARCAVIGPNGAGKTTFIDTLLGRRTPDAGRIKLGHNVQTAYYTQHGEEFSDRSTVLEAMLAGLAINQQQGRTILGRFLFPGDLVEKKVSVLSGGERRRLSLARLVATGANLLVLDEPTNHLDVESREALEDALNAYDGTILFVSHDRALIDGVATETLALEDQRLTLRPGDYNDYVRDVERRRAAASAPPPPPPPGKKAPKVVTTPAPTPAAGGGRKAKQEDPARNGGAARTKKRVGQLERSISEVESRIAVIEGELGDPSVLADRDLLADALTRHAAAEAELARLMRDWETASLAADRA
jgi:ATP-binding cassette subfamily F protein 3